MDLNRRLAHEASAPRRICLGGGCGAERIGSRKCIDAPRRVQAAAARPFEVHDHIGHQVLQRLERADRLTELLTVLGIRQP